jgi:hypothetical protein
VEIKYWCSRAKVENVVNPPQKPIAKKFLIAGLNDEFLKEAAKIIPISKLPIMLTANVCQGKEPVVCY